MRDLSGWPSIARYLDWARAQGCATQIASAPSEGSPYQIVTITAASGRCAIEAFLLDDDPLMSTTVARLDRRLGLKSTFFI